MSRALPVATYRLQLTPRFGFRAAASVAPYVRALGVSHLYLSPVFEARPGSTHGYDQTDPGELRAELGGAAGFGSLAEAARAAGLGIVLDIVPNHMAADHRNPWWWAVLREGPGSACDRFFDIDWGTHNGRVVLPVLGKPLADAIACNEMVLEEAGEGAWRLRYFDRHFPLREGSLRTGDIHGTLRGQHYELVHWRDGLRTVNYRRFFDVSDLVGVRVEDNEVFDAMHTGLLQLVAAGHIDGVRVDHVDGLADPAAYLSRLRRCLDLASPPGRRVFVLVEKILARGERLPASWEVDGTTGYEFGAAAAAVGVAWDGVRRLRAHGVETGGGWASFSEGRTSAKAEIAKRLLTPETRRVVRRMLDAADVAETPLRAGEVERTIVAASSRLGVYRTYVDHRGPTPEDAAHVAAALAGAKSDLRDEEHPTADAVADMLLMRGAFARRRARLMALSAAITWQQFTGPLAAKGVEDTALYRDMAFPALNEVGNEPEERDAAAEMASVMADRRGRSRFSLNTTATHDTKRGEDTRARLAAVSHEPVLAAAALNGARELFGEALHPADERLLVLTLIALAPLEGEADRTLVDRVKAYARKASREAKERTDWIDPDEAYEKTLDACVETLLIEPAGATVRALARDAARATRRRAAQDSLACVLLKTLAPGVPDFYQGCEFVDLSLVDPDNRREVEWGDRREALADLERAWLTDPRAAAARFLADADADAAKLFVTWRALAIRRWLLGPGAGLHFGSFEWSVAGRRWAATSDDGRRQCRVEMTPATPDHTSPSIDQLTGTNGGVWLGEWTFHVSVRGDASAGLIAPA